MKKILYSLLLVTIIAGLFVSILHLQKQLDLNEKIRETNRTKVIYLISPKYARLISLGYYNALANYMYLWSVQFFSFKRETYRFSVIDEVYDFITELDPKYVEAYRIGSLIMIKDVAERQRNPEGHDMAIRLLDKGIQNNPGKWILPFTAAGYYQFTLKNYKKAFKYYELALKADDLPDFYRKRFSKDRVHNLQKFDRKQALAEWYTLWKTSEDEVTRNIAYSKFYDLKIDLDIEFLENAITKFKAIYEKNPSYLSDLIRSGIIKNLPRDPNGLPYLYNPATSKVKPPKGYSIRKKQFSNG